MAKWKGYHFKCATCSRAFSTHIKTVPGLTLKDRCCSKSCSARRLWKIGEWKPRYTEEQLLIALREEADLHGRAPMKIEMKIPSAATFRARFGSWNKAIAAAGLIPRLAAPIFEGERVFILSKSRFQILKRDNFTCQYCGGTPALGYVLHVDHKIPRSKGGKTELDNLITACIACNLGKKDS